MLNFYQKKKKKKKKKKEERQSQRFIMNQLGEIPVTDNTIQSNT